MTNTKSLAEYAIERMVQAELALQALVQEYEVARAEIERLKTRVGWLDHLDTEEGRRMHANEALAVEIERLKANANLGSATTQELLEELMARARTGGYDQYMTLESKDKQ